MPLTNCSRSRQAVRVPSVEGVGSAFQDRDDQIVANRPRGSGLAERSNQSILQRLRTHGIFGNNEWDVDLLFAEIPFNKLTSNSLRLSPFEIGGGRTLHFPLDFPRMTSHAHEPSTVNDYMQRAERTFDSVRAMLAEERRRQMHVVLQIDRHVRVPEMGERWLVLVPEYRHKGKVDVVWCGPYKVLEVLNKGENVKLDILASFQSRPHKALHPSRGTASVGVPDAPCQNRRISSTCQDPG